MVGAPTSRLPLTVEPFSFENAWLWATPLTRQSIVRGLVLTVIRASIRYQRPALIEL